MALEEDQRCECAVLRQNRVFACFCGGGVRQVISTEDVLVVCRAAVCLQETGVKNGGGTRDTEASSINTVECFTVRGGNKLLVQLPLSSVLRMISISSQSVAAAC